MGIIKPTLTLTANARTATTDAGPVSVALQLSATDSLTVDSVQSKIVVPANSGAPTLLLAGNDYAGDGADTPGTHGSFLYLKNVTASGSSFIYVGMVRQGATDPADFGTGSTSTALDNADDATDRVFTLLRGEFCWMPWDYMQDIYVGGSSADQSLEYWLFNRG